MRTYTVYYWSGGREVGHWSVSSPIPMREAAIERQALLNRMGYVAYLGLTSDWQAIGGPEGPPSDKCFRALGL